MELVDLDMLFKKYLLIRGGTLPVREGVCGTDRKGRGQRRRSALRGLGGFRTEIRDHFCPSHSNSGPFVGLYRRYQSVHCGGMRGVGRVLETVSPS